MNKLFITAFITICLSSCALASGVSKSALPYNYKSTEYYLIKLSPLETFSTKDDLTDGQIIKFRVCDDVIVRGKKILKKDMVIDGKIETIILPRRGGNPGQIMIDNFDLPDIKQSQLISEYTQKGNYKWWLNLIKFPVPLFPFSYIAKGSAAKIKEKDVITIKYFPGWK